MFSSRQKTIT